MNKATLSLALASLVLAATTAYLMNEVRHERAGSGASSARDTSNASPTTGGVPDQAGDPAKREGKNIASPANEESSAASTSGTSRGRASMEVRTRLQNESIIRMYNDPQGRHELIEERIPILRDKFLPLQRRLKIDDLQWLRFMEVVAERELGFMAARADCQVANNCDQLKFTPEMMTEDQRRIAEVLGDENAREVRRFERSDMERRSVRDLQQEVSEGLRLPEDRAEQFVMALATVRDEVLQQMNAVQATHGSFFDGRGGLLLYDKSLPTAEARLESATNYSRQLREQARKYLSGQLLTDFNRQQDELLKRMRASDAKAGP